jgi:hypothetical protein
MSAPKALKSLTFTVLPKLARCAVAYGDGRHGQPHALFRKRTGSLRGPQRAGVHPPEQHQVPIFVIGVPAIICPARCFGGSTTTPSQTMRFTVCPLT